MVEKQTRRELRPSDNVQTMGVPGVPGQNPSGGQDEGGIWHLRTQALLFHHAHILDGYRNKDGGQRSQRCGFCREGVVAVLERVLPPVSEPEGDASVDEGDRADQEGPAASPPGGRWPWRATDTGD